MIAANLILATAGIVHVACSVAPAFGALAAWVRERRTDRLAR